HGVNDVENYPYLLSRYWPEWQVVNKAVMAWGTSHAYMVLAEELESARPPSMVVYATTPDIILRNYKRRSWVKYLSQYDRDHPYFEIVDGKLAYQGIVASVADGEPDSPELRDKELELTT